MNFAKVLQGKLDFYKHQLEKTCSHLAREHMDVANDALETISFFVGRYNEQPALSTRRIDDECRILDSLMARLS